MIKSVSFWDYGFFLVLKIESLGCINIKKNINKARFYINQKLDRGTLLINYVGKRKNAEDKIKGVSIKLFNKMAKNHYGHSFTPRIFGFMSEHSKTKTIVTQDYTVTSKYCMYQRGITP